jgi:hypothetical protein
MTRICRDCRHYRPGHHGPSGAPGKQSVCLREREPPAAPPNCAAARGASGDCGPAALLFEGRDGVA